MYNSSDNDVKTIFSRFFVQPSNYSKIFNAEARI